MKIDVSKLCKRVLEISVFEILRVVSIYEYRQASH